MSINRRKFIKHTTLAVASAAAVQNVNANPKPNIIVINTDDQRWDAMGCAGNSIIKTPAMDQLAKHGTRFANNFCTTSICMSSRASILTGLHERSHGIVRFNIPLPEHLFQKSFPIQLRDNGYQTGFVGKWGLGGPLPQESFDYFDGFSGQGFYYEEDVWQGEHLTEKLGQSAVNFIETTNNSHPFCLMLYTKAPHVQDQDPEQFLHDQDLIDLYADDDIPRPHTATEEHFEKLPIFLQNSEARVRWKKRFANEEMRQRSVKRYYRLITGVDIIIGDILRKLKEKGMDQNTVILLTSDNGFYLGEHGLAGKWFMHEESIRTPLLVYDPRLPKAQQGQVIETMSLNIDIAPTILDLAGIEPDPTVQGKSLLPAVYGQNNELRDEWFYEHNFDHPRIPKSEGIRNKEWKYIWYPKKEYESLFNLINDPHEENDLARNADYQKQLVEMRLRHQAWVNQLAKWPEMGEWQPPD